MNKPIKAPADASSLRVDLPTLREQTLETLRDAICNLQFAPGERLVERRLCELTGVSRTSIREALRHLESEGLVKNVARRGPSVAEITVNEARQIYQVRGAIEGLAAWLFARNANPEYIQRLKVCLEELKEATNNKDLLASLRANDDFYQAIFEGSGNEVACGVSRSLRARINLMRAQVTARWDKTNNARSLRRMETIVAAFEAGDADAARAAIEEHAVLSAQTMLDILEAKERRAA